MASALPSGRASPNPSRPPSAGPSFADSDGAFVRGLDLGPKREMRDVSKRTATSAPPVSGSYVRRPSGGDPAATGNASGRSTAAPSREAASGRSSTAASGLPSHAPSTASTPSRSPSWTAGPERTPFTPYSAPSWNAGPDRTPGPASWTGPGTLTAASWNVPNHLGPARPDIAQAKCWRNAFTIMSLTFGVNFSVVWVVTAYSKAVLDIDSKQASGVVLFGVTLVAALFIAPLVTTRLGCKTSLFLGMASYTCYIISFALAAVHCTEWGDKWTCSKHGPWQAQLAIGGSIFGGLGTSIMWTAQGAFFSAVVERVAIAELLAPECISTQLAGSFGFYLLIIYAAFKLLLVLLRVHFQVDATTTFFVYSGIAALSCVAILQTTDVRRDAGRQQARTSSFGSNSLSTPWRASLNAVKLWKEPSLWLLQFTNITYGFATAWLNNHIIAQTVETEYNQLQVGLLYVGMTLWAAVSCVLLRCFGTRFGKACVIFLGSVSFMGLVLLSQTGNPEEWGAGMVVFYLFYGVGEAVFYTTNRSVMVDFFPGAKSSGAFANATTSANAIAMVGFCLHNFTETGIDSLSQLTLLAAFMTFPAFCWALMLQQQREHDLLRDRLAIAEETIARREETIAEDTIGGI